MPFNALEHRYRVFLVCVAGIFVTVFDTSAAIVALPTIAQEFGTDLPMAQWVVIGNGVTIAALLVPMGHVSDMISRKLIYVVGACCFGAGAVLATLSEGMPELIGARVVVGIGSAMTQSTAMAILISNFEPNERGRMLGWQLGVVGLGAIAGPATGGIIVGTAGWRVLFAITAVFMIVIALSAQWILHRRPKRQRGEAQPFDYAGALLFSGFLVTLLLTLTLGPRIGWLEPGTLLGCALAPILLAAFVAVEFRSPAPMMDPSLFRIGAFSLGALGAVVTFMGISSTRYLTPFFLQGVKGFSPSEIGLAIMPAALVTAVAAPFAGRLADRWGTRRFANMGIAIALVGLAMFSQLETTTPVWSLISALMILSLGLATFSAANSASILNSVSSRAHGLTAGFVNLCRNSGNVIGIALGTAIVTLRMGADGHAPSLAEVAPDANRDVLLAFTSGMRITATTLLTATSIVLVILLTWSWRVVKARRQLAATQIEDGALERGRRKAL
jgi:EmrB/QacA subfamily drug resistance transporter